MRVRTTITLLATTCVLPAFLAAGCSSGGGKNKGGSPITSTAVALSTPALNGSQTAARVGSDAVGFVFRLMTPAGGQDVTLTSITIRAAGTVDESLELGGLKLISDDDRDGFIGAGEATLASIPSSAFTADNGSATISPTTSLVIPAGGTGRQFIVAVETGPNGPSAAGQMGDTIRFGLNAAADIAIIDSAGLPAAVSGTFPAYAAPVTLFMHDHLLITEVVTLPTGAEYIELFNPTPSPAILTNVYLTDHTVNAATTTLYQNLPTGTNFAPAAANATDFCVRFPAGATIGAGKALIIATDGTAFRAAYGRDADHCLRGAVAGVTSQQMLTPSGANWVPTAVANTVELRDGGEPVVAFYFDSNVANRVFDIDYVFWGAATGTDLHVNKSGVTVAGFTFPAETSAAAQAAVDGALPVPTQNGLRRVGFTEGNEKQTGGSGLLGGHDETSEQWVNTFGISVPTPGAP
ncbi:MAG: hypothetical protein AB7I13_16130 [Vicinamibacterales bacterium]